MSTLETLQQLDELTALAADMQAASAAGLPWPFDSLLNLIGSLVQKLLDAKIGSDGKTIKDIIFGVRDTITQTVNGLGGAIKNAKDTIIDKVDGVTGSITSTVNGITGAIKDRINSLAGEAGTTLSGIRDAISTKVTGAVDTLGGKIGGVVTTLSTKIDETMGSIGAAISGAIDKVVTKLGDIINSIKDIGSTIASSIAGAISTIADNIGDAVNSAITGAASFIGDAIASFKEGLGSLIKGIKDTIAGVIDTAKQWISGVYESISTSIKNVVQSLKDTYESVKGTVTEWLNKLISWLQGILQDLLEKFWGAVAAMGEWIATNFLPAWGEAVEWAQKISGLSPAVLEDLKKGDFTSLLAGIDNIFEAGAKAAVNSPLFALATAIAYFWNQVQLQFVYSQVAAAKRANIALGLDPISMDAAAQGVYRDLWGEDDFYNNAALGGVTSGRAKIVLEAGKPLVSPGQAQQLFLRGEISEQDHDKILKHYGFDNSAIKEIKSLYAIIPGVQDIITMAVREAFTPDIAQKFGQYEDLPEAFVQWAGKQGLTEEWASRYWASHWQLPSPQMGFGMFQRRIIDQEDLKLLLRALDVMPYWRERLIELAYNPITRVDVRRMYKVGVFDEEQVYSAYLDLGYSPDSAKNLTEFTKIYSPPEDQTEQDTFRALARSTYSQAYKRNIISEDEYKAFLINIGYAAGDAALLISIDDYAKQQDDRLFDLNSFRKDNLKLILNAYDSGLLTRDDTKGMLVDLGFEEQEAELELGLIDYNRQLALKNTLVKQLHDQYTEFTINADELNVIMSSFNFTTDEIEKLQEEWNIERSFRTRKPTLAQFVSFFKDGLLSLDQFTDELRGLGYPDKYVQLYLQQLAL